MTTLTVHPWVELARCEGQVLHVVDGVPEPWSVESGLTIAHSPESGLTIHVARGHAAERPLWVVFSGTASSKAGLRLDAGTDSALTLIELYLGAGSALTAIELAERARVRHVRVQHPTDSLTGTLTIHLARDAGYQFQGFSRGGRDNRLDQTVTLAGVGAEAELDGLADVCGEQSATLHSVVNHEAPHGRSRQLHKVLAADRASAEFLGRIRVERGAEQTDAAQSSRSLVLHPGARVETRPELMIFNDDVKCAHGAAVGQLDPEALFYLQARGLSAEEARELLITAFADEVIARVPVRALREALTQGLGKELSPCP